jgi:peptide/nickel transport system ATP-binding protein
MPQPLLDIRNATKIYGGGFLQRGEQTVALQNFNLTLEEQPARIVTIAGESGSGKTTLANVVLGFIGLSSGQILYRGQDVSALKGDALLDYRRQVQAVFQDPYEVYNPFYRVKHIFDMAISRFKLSRNASESRDMIEDALRVVGLRGEEVLEKYPHQLSGGQRQRMMVARAYMIKPRIIVADEPVSMVDASLRAMILDIMLRLRDQHNISFLYITHDLSTAYQIGDQIYILYQGSIAETGNTAAVIERPKHPYVQLLIESIPEPDPTLKWEMEIPEPEGADLRGDLHSGCRFYPRCRFRMNRCTISQPGLFSVDGSTVHQAACFLYDTYGEKGAGEATPAPVSSGVKTNANP